MGQDFVYVIAIVVIVVVIIMVSNNNSEHLGIPKRRRSRGNPWEDHSCFYPDMFENCDKNCNNCQTDCEFKNDMEAEFGSIDCDDWCKEVCD